LTRNECLLTYVQSPFDSLGPRDLTSDYVNVNVNQIFI